MWLGVKREDLMSGAPAKAGKDDPDDPNAGAVV
jgi:preprotein translocase subunit SecF